MLDINIGHDRQTARSTIRHNQHILGMNFKSKESRTFPRWRLPESADGHVGIAAQAAGTERAPAICSTALIPSQDSAKNEQ